MLYMLKAILLAGSVGSTVAQLISKWSFSPGLKVLHEAEHPNRYVLFRGCGSDVACAVWQEMPLSSPPCSVLVWLTERFWCSWALFLWERSVLWGTPNASSSSRCPYQRVPSRSLEPRARRGGLEHQAKPGLQISRLCVLQVERLNISRLIPWVHSGRTELLADTDIASAAFVYWRDWNCASSDAAVN